MNETRSPHFDESVEFADKQPHPGWVPSPRQIAEWSLAIRVEHMSAMLDSQPSTEWYDDEYAPMLD